MVVLFTPKILGIVRIAVRARAAAAADHRDPARRGRRTILSALYAPIMMLVRGRHISILTGRDSGWTRSAATRT